MFRLFASLLLLAGLIFGQLVEGSLKHNSVVTGGSAQMALTGAIGDSHDDGENGTDGVDALHDCPHMTCSHGFLVKTDSVAGPWDYGPLKEVQFNNRFLRSVIFTRDPPIPKSLI